MPLLKMWSKRHSIMYAWLCTQMKDLREKNALFKSENKIGPDTSKDEHCQASHLACLKNGHTL